MQTQNVERGVVDWILINISSSNILWKFLLLERYHQDSQAVLGNTGMNCLNNEST